MIVQDNPSKSISDMRKAIQDTNIILNKAITPGIILIPSNMIILKNKVEGCNNMLTLATNAMKFGVNKNVNYVAPAAKKTPACYTDETCSCYTGKKRSLKRGTSLKRQTTTYLIFWEVRSGSGFW